MNTDVTRYTTPELIQQNLEEPDARHLMLLTKNNAALRLLFEGSLLDHGKAEVMFGSTFPNDQSDIFVAMNLQRIKSFMQQPISLVMVHCDSLYESLYDLLNQHYMEYAGQRFVRIAHGSKAKQCPVHRLFRVIVVTEISDAYFRLAPPLLNRFEKQIFLRKDLMTRADEALLNKLSKFFENLNELMNAGVKTDEEVDAIEELISRGTESSSKNRPIAGYHAELLSSLVFTLRKQMASKSSDEIFEEAKKRLVWVLTPEAVCIAAATLTTQQMKIKFGFDIVQEYFANQSHSDLPSFASMFVKDKKFWCDDLGAQSVILTYSPIRGKVGVEVKEAASCTEVSLHELSSSTDIENSVKQFYEGAPAEAGKRHFLIIHADPVAASVRMIEHCRFVCEKMRSDCVKKGSPVNGSMFVVLIVHLQRGVDGKFSFDFDSQWGSAFLDSVETTVDLNSMPALGDMLNMPLQTVVEGLEFPKLLQTCFRSALSRLIYPHARRPGDLQRQIQLILGYIEDADFVRIVRDWTLHVLRTTPQPNGTGTVGEDKNWFAAIATAAHELALAGTFRAALHGRVVVLVSSLITALWAHMDRNASMELLAQPAKRELWLKLSEASLLSPLSVRLQNEAVSALSESSTAQHEVGTDAQTSARPFSCSFPASWFVCRSIDQFRSIIEQKPGQEQLSALTAQYQLSKLAEIGINPVLGSDLLEGYMMDFTAMHLDWTERIGRDIQYRILKKTIQRLHPTPIASILEVHALFWRLEKQIAFSVNLLNAVPGAVSGAEKLIDESDIDMLNLDLLLLVHETLANELTSGAASSEAQGFYRDWLIRKNVVQGLTKDFLISVKDNANGSPEAKQKLTKLKSNTEPRIETLALLLQHVAYPLHLPEPLVKSLALDLPKDKIRHSGTLKAMLKFTEAVVAADKSDREHRLQASSAFIESWILDVCLRDAEATSDLEEASLRLVCNISAGLPVVIQPNSLQGIGRGDMDKWAETQDVGIAQLSDGSYIPRSSCLNLALMRKLIIVSTGEAKEKATKYVEDLLKDIAKHEKHNDTTFSTRFAILCEEEEGIENDQDPETWPDMTLEMMFSPETKADPAKMLQRVGQSRQVLSKYATILYAEQIDVDLHARAVPKVEALLQTSKPEFQSVCRSMRLYLLKCLERVRGLSFVRGLLVQPVLDETSWVKNWREMHDIDFEKFIGAALVPRWNPFSNEEATKEYTAAMQAVLEMMTSTSTEKLSKLAKDMQGMPDNNKRKALGGLFLALAQEPGLLAALEEADRRPPWRAKLNEWLEKSTDLPVSDKERMLLRIFAGDESPIRKLPQEEQDNLETFIVFGRGKMDDLLRWRVLAHLAAALIAAPQGSLLHSLRLLMLDSSTLMDGSPCFLPGMDEDIRNRVMKALVEKGENIWKFKSHWYKCTCGYTFFIGECGRPMETTKCPQCGLNIGGRDHNKTTSTYEDDETDRSPWGYCLPVADKDEKHATFREIQSSSARTIRLLLHGGMYCGILANIHAAPPMVRTYNHIVNNESMCSMKNHSEASYIGTHFAYDWKSMVDILSSNTEDVSVALHRLLLSMSVAESDEPVKSADGTAAGYQAAWGVQNLAKRNSWEETIEAKYLKQQFNSKWEEALQDCYKKWGGDQEDGKFVAELKEAADLKAFPSQKREDEMPQLWAFRSAVTLDALHNKIGQESRAKDTLPVLCRILEPKLANILPALGRMVGVFDWQNLCMNQFSGRLTKADAGKMTVAEVLATVPRSEAERIQWTRAFKAFKTAWRYAMPYAEYECLVVSEETRAMRISEDDSMLWCIPDSKDEGLYALMILDWLTAQHNELVQVVASALGYPARKVSSRLLGEHDVIKYSKDTLMKFLRSRCVTYAVGGKLNLDLKQLEHVIRREMSRPEITIEMRGFQWLGDTFSAGNELKTVINQKDLSPDTIQRLKVELASPAVANICLQKVQMSMSFILKSGSSLGTDHAGEMRLSEYMSSVLSERADSLPSACARADVHLWHVDAFVKVLRGLVNKDPMDSIDVKYKADLDADLLAQVKAAKPKLPKSVSTMMGIFAETRLTETWIGFEYDIMTILDSVQDSIQIDEEGWQAMQEHFPKELKMMHWAAIYGVLTS